MVGMQLSDVIKLCTSLVVLTLREGCSGQLFGVVPRLTIMKGQTQLVRQQTIHNEEPSKLSNSAQSCLTKTLLFRFYFSCRFKP